VFGWVCGLHGSPRPARQRVVAKTANSLSWNATSRLEWWRLHFVLWGKDSYLQILVVLLSKRTSTAKSNKLDLPSIVMERLGL
jgi:hypothetical protein